MITEGLVLFGVSAIGGIGVWALRLESRITANDVRHVDLKELIEVRFDAVDQRLERIEKALNGAIHKD